MRPSASLRPSSVCAGPLCGEEGGGHRRPAGQRRGAARRSSNARSPLPLPPSSVLLGPPRPPWDAPRRAYVFVHLVVIALLKGEEGRKRREGACLLSLHSFAHSLWEPALCSNFFPLMSVHVHLPRKIEDSIWESERAVFSPAKRKEGFGRISGRAGGASGRVTRASGTGSSLAAPPSAQQLRGSAALYSLI